MIRTLDDIMFIVDGNNPYRINLMYGTGGLNYHPYLPISGGAISDSESDEEDYSEEDKELIKDIDSVLKTDTYHLFHKGKLIKEISHPAPITFNKNIKKYINAPEKAKKVFVIRLFPKGKDGYYLQIQISKKYLNKYLNLITNDDCYAGNFSYTKDDLRNIGFTMDILKKLIKMVDNKKNNIFEIMNIKDALNIIQTEGYGILKHMKGGTTGSVSSGYKEIPYDELLPNKKLGKNELKEHLNMLEGIYQDNLDFINEAPEDVKQEDIIIHSNENEKIEKILNDYKYYEKTDFPDLNISVNDNNDLDENTKKEIHILNNKPREYKIEQYELLKDTLLSALSNEDKKYNEDNVIDMISILNKIGIQGYKKLEIRDGFLYEVEDKLKKSEIHTKEFIKEQIDKEELLKTIKEYEKPEIFDIEEQLKYRYNDIIKNYKEQEEELKSKDKLDIKYSSNEAYEFSFMNDDIIGYDIDIKNISTDEKTKYSYTINYYDDFKPPLLRSNEHLNSLIKTLDPDEYNKLINGNAVIKEYINTGANVFKFDKDGNKKQIWYSNPNDVYDNIITIKYNDNGIEKEYKVCIENKYFGGKSYAKDEECYYKNILDINEKIDLVNIEDINKDIRDAMFLEDYEEVERLKKINPSIHFGIGMSWGKFGIVLSDELNWQETSKGTIQEYQKLRSNYSSNRNPVFDENGIIIDMCDKFGNILPKNNIENKKFIGAKVLYNVKLQDCEVGLNYSNMIKEEKINPRNPLLTHKIGKSQYGKSKKKTKYTSILLTSNDLHIIMK